MAFLQDIPLRMESKKLSSCYIDPFVIKSIINPTAVKLKLSTPLEIHPTFHVSQLKPVQETLLCTPARPPPPARVIDGHLAITVQRILEVWKGDSVSTGFGGPGWTRGALLGSKVIYP